MKFVKFPMLLLAATMMVFASCSDDEDEIKTEPGTETEPETTELSSAAQMTSFVLNAGGVTFDGFFYNTNNTVEIAYPGYQYSLLTSATAEVVISDGATISPDPTVARDYTVEGGVVYTVTAEDGEHTNDYTITIVEAEEVITVRETFNKTFGELNISNSKFNNNGVAFSGPYIVTFDAQVYNLDGTYAGKLNLDGVTAGTDSSFQFGCMSNDANGVLVATVPLTSENGIASNSDSVARTEDYMWANGWDSAPTKIFEDNYNFAIYMSVAGDVVNGPCILNFPTPSRDATQMHHVRYYPAGLSLGSEGCTWYGPTVQYPSNDGNWGQALSFTEGDPESEFVVCDSRSNNEGMQILVCHGISNMDYVTLSGTVGTDALADGHGTDEYGNYSTGCARAFKLNGRSFVACATTGWDAAYLTVQTLDPNDEDHYLLRTVRYDAAECVPGVAVYTDSSTGNTYVVMLPQNYSMILYTITVQYV